MKFFNRPRVRKSVRYISVCLMLVAAILAVAIVASLTVDLGPAARRALETQGSKYIERPMRIGRLSIHVLTGKYVIEDMIIDGLHPATGRSSPRTYFDRDGLGDRDAAASGVPDHVGRNDRLADARREMGERGPTNYAPVHP